MTFDEVRNRYFEELAETDAGRATLLLESAIAYARGVSGPGVAPAGLERLRVENPQVEFAGEISRLISWAANEGISGQSISDERYGTQDTEGTEHWVWFENSRVRKISFSNPDHFDQGPFGQTIEAFEDTGPDGEVAVVIENRKGSPSEYLERLYLQNVLFRIDNRLEALSEFGIETTQPLFTGEPLTEERLDSFLDAFGFVPVSALTYHHRGLHVALSDIALHNVIKTGAAIFPFDIWARRIKLP